MASGQTTMPGRWKFKVPSSRFSVGFLVDDPARDFCLPQSNYFFPIFLAVRAALTAGRGRFELASTNRSNRPSADSGNRVRTAVDDE
jgi:hypothetical protein